MGVLRKRNWCSKTSWKYATNSDSNTPWSLIDAASNPEEAGGKDPLAPENINCLDLTGWTGTNTVAIQAVEDHLHSKLVGWWNSAKSNTSNVRAEP